VRRDEIKDDPPAEEPALRGLYLADDMKQRTDHGAAGYPEQATAEKGRACLAAAIDRTVLVIQELLRRPLPR
jgi:creatinine amidohydrolase/Fe(II)-dependent formamide hydrolase-like protein